MCGGRQLLLVNHQSRRENPNRETPNTGRRVACNEGLVTETYRDDACLMMMGTTVGRCGGRVCVCVCVCSAISTGAPNRGQTAKQSRQQGVRNKECGMCSRATK